MLAILSNGSLLNIRFHKTTSLRETGKKDGLINMEETAKGVNDQ